MSNFGTFDLFPISPNDLLPFVLEVPIDHSDLVADLLKELSNHNERVEERKGALLELLKITREDNLGVWEEHFKTILLLLLETLGDKDVRCRFCLNSPVLCFILGNNSYTPVQMKPATHQ